MHCHKSFFQQFLRHLLMKSSNAPKVLQPKEWTDKILLYIYEQGCIERHKIKIVPRISTVEQVR